MNDLPDSGNMDVAIEIRTADTDAEIARCHAIMAQLRHHLGAEGFVEGVRRQMQTGYRLVYLMTDGEVAAVAGFRIMENLFLGRFLYVDDFVTDESRRSRTFGKNLFRWLVEFARSSGCGYLELDSGVQRFDAHRFYYREGMHIRSHHFSMKLKP